MSNAFYVANIRRKGIVVGGKALRYELEKVIRGFKFQVSSFKLASQPGVKDFKEVKNGAQVIGEIPKQVRDDMANQVRADKKKFILREEFPFLGRADCPEEFKIMVNDMITSHARYVEGHEKLFHAAGKDNSTCYSAAEEVVENYLNNRFIWEELHYYKNTGKILGLHEAFAKRVRTTELETMEPAGLMKLYRNLPRNIQYYQQLMRDDQDSEKQKERQERLDWFGFELNIVKRLLGIKEVKANEKKKRKAKRLTRLNR
ncbi:MAG TPA: hypothetical protein DCL77_14345 [Prolixibacteraceae bacterium]|nr:hypothetical protein [Prolixibacteraceae bacterium]